MTETLKAPLDNPARQAAKQLVYELLHEPEQLALFEADEMPDIKLVLAEDLRVRYPDNLVIPAKTIGEYRYQAAYKGAGFAPAEFDAITYRDDEGGVAVSVFLGVAVTKVVFPGKILNPNKMHDDIENEPFTHIVPTTRYDLGSGHFITSEEDLTEIFEFDYNSLRVWRDMGSDLLYEREL